MGKILFIGAGNMGEAIISGILKNKCYKPEEIFIYEINQETKAKVMSKYNVSEYNKIDKDIEQFDFILLAIKPQVFLSIEKDQQLINIKKFITEKQTIISIMAGIKIEKIKAILGNNLSVVRVMPNTPALVGMAMSVISSDQNVSKEKLEKIKEIFDSIGKTEIMEEKYMDAVTALSGSGPAYLFIFIEALVEAGILIGLSKDVAEKLVIQTIAGSINLVEKERKNKTVEELRHMVTSPAGTTINAINIFEKHSFRGIIMEAVQKAYERSIELGK